MNKKDLMGKGALMAVAALISVLLAAPAFAETAPAASPAPEKTQVDHKAERAAHFNEHKQKLLKKIGEHIAEMQKRQSCVQASKDTDAMWACFPHDGAGAGGLDYHVENHGSEAAPAAGAKPPAKH